MDYRGRIAALAENMAEARLTGILVPHLPPLRYLCGFSGSAGTLIIPEREATLFTDGRYREQSRKEVKGCKIRIGAASALAQASKWLGSSSLRRIGIDAGHLTVGDQRSEERRVGKEC